ncbi:MAG: hypothetical protein HY706_13545 [Candidatus Hydrogenedentes bacterium]|nr:hypothetical protein [Candidatus Hydrogenedentota bacterium]
MRETLSQDKVVAAAFRPCIHPSSLPLKIIQAATNLRAKYLRLPYGDQALAIPAELFHQLHGFAELPIMEDVEILTRLRFNTPK